MVRAASGTAGETRRRILLESSRLFSRRGYYGTSTRDIADVVGIRQPSLFHHFAAKHEILAELVDNDVGSSLIDLRVASELDASWAERLHYYVLSDAAAFLSQEIDAGGLYGPAIFVEPEFDRQRLSITELHDRTEELIQNGITAGEFIDIESAFVRRAEIGISFEGMRERGPYPRPALGHRPQQIADFVVRAILRDPDSLDVIRGRSLARLVARRDDESEI